MEENTMINVNDVNKYNSITQYVEFPICYSCKNIAIKKCNQCKKILCLIHHEKIINYGQPLDLCINCLNDGKYKKKEIYLITIIILTFINILAIIYNL